jgi:hypothetical protein
MRRLFIAVFLLTTVAGGELLSQQVGQELANPLVPAQRRPRVYVGPVVGYNRALHSSGFQSVAGDVLCPTFETGSGNGFYAGGSFEYLLGSPTASRSSIIVKALYDYMPAYYEVPGDQLPSLGPDGSVVNSTVRHVAEVKYTTVALEGLYKLNLFDSYFGVVVGPTVGLVISADREQRMELVEPLNAVFDPALVGPDVEYINNGRAIITRRDDLPEKNGIRVGIKAGVQYELPIGRLLFVPHIFYNYGITEVSPTDNLRINALQMGVDLRFAL